MTGLLLEKENNKISEQIPKAIISRVELDCDLYNVQKEIEKGVTLFNAAMDCLDRVNCSYRPNIEDEGREQAINDLSNCLYIMEDLFKNMTNRLDETQNKYCR